MVEFNAQDAVTFGQIKTYLADRGQLIGPYDLLIAAQALSRDLVLVTNNLREFERVPGLKCENWV